MPVRLAASSSRPSRVLTPTTGMGAGREQAREHLRHRLGLDLPVFYVSRTAKPGGQPRWHWHGRQNQYHRWLSAIGRGNLGVSLRTGQPVAAQLAGALGYTAPITGAALALVAGLALLLGQQLAGSRRWWHAPVRTALVAAHSMPLFVVATSLLLLFANPEVLAWFPGYGLSQEAASFSWAYLRHMFPHLVLPVTSLVLVALPGLALQLEAAIRQELGRDYATTARAKGLENRSLIRHQALRNALLPTLTQLTDLVPTLVSGALVVEVVFALPGMGRLLVEAVALRDYPVLLGGVVLAGAARLAALALADVLYQGLDPRIQWLD